MIARQITRRLGECGDKFGLKIALQVFGQIDGSGGILQALNRLDTGELIVKPAAGGEHQHRVALHFEQPQGFSDLIGVEVGMSVAGHEAANGFVGVAIEQYFDVGVAGVPRALKIRAPARAIDVVELELQPVERLPERAAPALVPVAPVAAAAIGTPALDAVCAAPGAVLMDLGFPLGRVELEKLAVVRQPDVWVLGQAIEDVSQRHVAVGMMMAVRFAVGGDVHELGMPPPLLETRGLDTGETARRHPAAARRRPGATHSRRRRKARSTGQTPDGKGMRATGRSCREHRAIPSCPACATAAPGWERES